MAINGSMLDESTVAVLGALGVIIDKGNRLRWRHEGGFAVGRWMKREEEAKVLGAVEGYAALPPELLDQDDYTGLERFYLAAAAAETSPSLFEDSEAFYKKQTANLEEMLKTAQVGLQDGEPSQRVKDAYYAFNVVQYEQGRNAVFAHQFSQIQLELVRNELTVFQLNAHAAVDAAKANISSGNYVGALSDAITASGAKELVRTIRPQYDQTNDLYDARQITPRRPGVLQGEEGSIHEDAELSVDVLTPVAVESAAN